MKRRPSEAYVTEKVEAYEIAIETLRAHESVAYDGSTRALAYRLRKRLADKLDREIQRWVDSLPARNRTNPARHD